MTSGVESATARSAGGRAVGILSPHPSRPGSAPAALGQDVLADLHLDQLFGMLLAGREEFDLLPTLLHPLPDLESTGFRQAVFRDLERPPLAAVVRGFAGEMREVRSSVARATRVRHRYQRSAWVLAAVLAYCGAVRRLAAGLGGAAPDSAGLREFSAELSRYVGGEDFARLEERAKRVAEGLSGVEYCVRLVGNRVVVRRFRGEPDHARAVDETFSRFRQGEVDGPRFDLPNPLEMNPVELRILELVARLLPEPFRGLEEFVAASSEFLCPLVSNFDREVQFYLAYLDLLPPLRELGLQFCYPALHLEPGDESANATFDLVLAATLARSGDRVVANDYRLEGAERVLVVTGPNQGGKTTFARSIGQLHHLAALGCPVPGREARICLVDAVFTQFGRQEDLTELRGRLEQEVDQLDGFLSRATPRSLLILNEIFSATSLQDALLLGRAAVRRLVAVGATGVLVTFVDELSDLGPETVSMVSTVDPQEPTRRTFKLVRRSADGLAYALAVAHRYGLTAEQLRGRLRR